MKKPANRPPSSFFRWCTKVVVLDEEGPAAQERSPDDAEHLNLPCVVVMVVRGGWHPKRTIVIGGRNHLLVFADDNNEGNN